MEALIFSINTVVPIFLVIIAGALFKKWNILNDKFSDITSIFVFIAAFPALLFMNIANSDFSGIFNRELLFYTIIFALSSTQAGLSQFLLLNPLKTIGIKGIQGIAKCTHYFE